MKKDWLLLAVFLVYPLSSLAQEKPFLGDDFDQPTPSGSWSLYPFYLTLGIGVEPTGAGFGAEGDPWVDWGSATLANGFGKDYGLGYSLELGFGVSLDQHWDLGLNNELDFFNLPQTYASTMEINLIPSARYVFDRSWATPFITAGTGLNINTDYAPITNETNPYYYSQSAQDIGADTNALSTFNWVTSLGTGLLFYSPFDHYSDFYLQARWDEVYTNRGSFAYFPITVGYLFQGHP